MTKKTKNICTTVQIFSCYNNYYKPPGGMEASTSLYYLIQQCRLTDCLEVLETLGFAEERAVVVLGAVQTLQTVGGVAW